MPQLIYLRGLFDVPDALRRAPLRSVTHRRQTSD